ncbi:hypothetical protein, partial [Propionivibrio sp.]|uniref:hypothetical protein n=1 Tax=Propionivibrio sp. TaxID=2212460 RepID=UPI003BF046B4
FLARRQGGIHSIFSRGWALLAYYRRGIKNYLTVEGGMEATKSLQRVAAAADISTVAGDFAIDISSGAGESASSLVMAMVVSL